MHSLIQRPGPQTHCDRAVRFPMRDLEAHGACSILAFKCGGVSTRVQYGDGKRLQVSSGRLFKGGSNDRSGLIQRNTEHAPA